MFYFANFRFAHCSFSYFVQSSDLFLSSPGIHIYLDRAMTRMEVSRAKERREEEQEEVEGWWYGTAPLVAKLKTVSGFEKPNLLLLWTRAWYWVASVRWDSRALPSQEEEVEEEEGATSIVVQEGELATL
jgi:hypothetical protein